MEIRNAIHHRQRYIQPEKETVAVGGGGTRSFKVRNSTWWSSTEKEKSSKPAALKSPVTTGARARGGVEPRFSRHPPFQLCSSRGRGVLFFLPLLALRDEQIYDLTRVYSYVLSYSPHAYRDVVQKSRRGRVAVDISFSATLTTLSDERRKEHLRAVIMPLPVTRRRDRYLHANSNNNKTRTARKLQTTGS